MPPRRPSTPGTLAFFRQLNAVLGLLVAPLLFVLLVGGALMSWYRHGRDPVYLDDPSIHIPAPPAGLTPAAGAVIRDGKSSRRALTTASLDLASRGLIEFEAEQTGLIAKSTELSIRDHAGLDAGPGGDVATRAGPRATDGRGHRVPAEPPPEHRGRRRSSSTRRSCSRWARTSTGFDTRLEKHVVQQGWFTEPPAKASGRWTARGIIAVIFGGIGVFVGINLPSDGLTVLAGALIAAGIVMLILSRSMPARTMPGAMIRAMLEAYRRTLEKTMAQSRSMGEVVRDAAIPLIESPDDAVVWGVALGLQSAVEDVLKRTTEDVQSGVAPFGYMPAWYGSPGGNGGAGGGSGGWAPGLMSSSPIPNFGGMMAALGTIGNSPSSSGSGGGGGFGGGGSGGGGGGAGGGF